MHTRPDHPTLLEAVASFLMESIAPKLEADKALQFRVLIAANVTATLANELRTNDAQFDAEAKALTALLPTDASPGLHSENAAERARALEALNARLSKHLRDGTLTPAQRNAALDALLSTTKSALEVLNPRFDTSLDL